MRKDSGIKEPGIKETVLKAALKGCHGKDSASKEKYERTIGELRVSFEPEKWKHNIEQKSNNHEIHQVRD